MSDLSELARPFPERLVKIKPGKFQAAYIEQSVVTQRLLEVLGCYSFEVTQIITNPDGSAVGCLARLTVTVDGREVTIVEVGDVEHPSPNNASNLKSAASDALKRCAARLGVGLHLYAGQNYYLDKALSKRETNP